MAVERKEAMMTSRESNLGHRAGHNTVGSLHHDENTVVAEFRNSVRITGILKNGEELDCWRNLSGNCRSESTRHARRRIARIRAILYPVRTSVTRFSYHFTEIFTGLRSHGAPRFRFLLRHSCGFSRVMRKGAHSEKKVYTYEEISKHNKEGDLWLIIEGRVCDVSSYGPDHPGGISFLLKKAGIGIF